MSSLIHRMKMVRICSVRYIFNGINVWPWFLKVTATRVALHCTLFSSKARTPRPCQKVKNVLLDM